MGLFLISLAMAGILAPLTPARASESCQGLDWRQARQPSAERALTARDLVRLRDIGPPGDDNPAAHILAISPDGPWVAFSLRRAQPEPNRHFLGMGVQSPVGGR